MKQTVDVQKTLICVPFAGGSSLAYASWEGLLPTGWKVLAAELPGRGLLANQRCLTQVSDIVDALIAQVEPALLSEEYYIFGHSLGALLAYEMAVRVDDIGYPGPSGMFLSAANPPHRLVLRQRHKHADDVFLEHLKQLGGLPPEVLDNPNMRAFILNVLRSDFTALETHRWSVKGQVDCPLHVLYSENDEMVERDCLPDWSVCTHRPTRLFNLGAHGHMFLEGQRAQILKLIAENGCHSFA